MKIVACEDPRGNSLPDFRIMNKTLPVKAVVTRQFPAAAERVFDAWLDPEMLGCWMFGPTVRDEQVVRLGIEPRVGGKFSFVVHRKGTEVDHVGQYLEIERPKLLVFTWATRDSLPDTSRVIVEIVPDGQRCELTLTHVMSDEWADHVDDAVDAWQHMLEKLEGVLG